MRLVAYCRVSTNKDEQLESLENQKEFFEEFAKRNNHTLIKMYSDEGISGKQMKNRKEFLKLMEDAKIGLFDLVAVKDVSRFARNTVDFLISIRKLKELNVDVLFLSTNQTVLGASEFVLTMFSALAQEESANLSERVKFGKKVNAKKGKVPNFIYGYDRIDNFTLEINREQSKVIKEIFDMYVNKNMGTRKISDTLTQNNISTFKNKDKWTPKTVRRILENKLYAGILISKKSEVINYLTGKTKMLEDVSEFTFIKPELKIIDEETFNKAQMLLEKNREIYKSRTTRKSGAYPLSTLIKCGKCNYSFTRRIRKKKEGKKAIWQCSGRNNNSQSFCANSSKINEDELIYEIADFLYKKIEDKKSFLKEINCKNGCIDKGANIKIKNLNDKKEKYMNMYINEIIDLSSLKNHIKKIEKEINSLSYGRTSNFEDKEISQKTLFKSILNALNTEYANAFLKEVIDKIICEDESVKIIWK